MMTSQVIRKLEARGLLERSSDPADSRARQLGLTAAGRAIVTAALADVEATDDAYFASLGDRGPAFVDALRALDTARMGEDAAPPDVSGASNASPAMTVRSRAAAGHGYRGRGRR